MTTTSSSVKEYARYANHTIAGWLKPTETNLPKSFKPMIHITQVGILIFCIVEDRFVVYNYDKNDDKTQEIASFNIEEYFHAGGEFIHYQSFLINVRYIYFIKNSFPTDEEHIYFYETKSKKLLSIKNDETRPQTFRVNHTVNFSQNDLKFYFFGGLNYEMECLNSIEVYNLETYQWEKLETKGVPPEPRHSHSSFLIGPNLYILGGTKAKDFYSKGGIFEDFHMLNLATMTWSPLRLYGESPQSLCYNYTFQLTRKYFIFASCEKNEDVWETKLTRFDLNLYEWKDMEIVSGTPDFRLGAGSCFDEESMTCILFGGLDPSKEGSKSLTNELNKIKISDSKDIFENLELLPVSDRPVKAKVVGGKEEEKEAEKEGSSPEGDSGSDEISFEEFLEREKRLAEEEKSKNLEKKKKKASRKKAPKIDKPDFLD